jgi:nucleoside-triphosphatase THEP1
MDIDFSKYKFRASELKSLMTEPKTKDEVLSVGAKTYLNEIYEDLIFGESPEVSTIEMQKGNAMEKDAIGLLRKISQKFYSKHPDDQKLENDFIEGHPDIKDDIDKEVIDIKCPFHVRTWFRYTEKQALDNYYWQILSYLWLTGYKKGKIAVCAMPTPEHLILQDAKKQSYFWRQDELGEEKFAEEEQKLYNLHNFGVIAEKDRIKLFDVWYNQDDVDRIISKVQAGREYLMQLASSEKLSLAIQKPKLLSFVDSELGATLEIESKVISKYREFGIELSFVEKIDSPSVIQYRFKPLSKGTKIEKAGRYSKDIQALFKSDDIRILTPIFGTDLIGIEFVKKQKDLLKIETSPKLEGVQFSIGRTVENKDYIIDFTDSVSPHLLVAGTTGSGKTVFLNSILTQLEANSGEDELKTIIIDPKNEFGKRKFRNGYAVESIHTIEETLHNLVLNMEIRYGKEIDLEDEQYQFYRQIEEKQIVVVIEELADLLGQKDKKELVEKVGSKDKMVNGRVETLDQFKVTQLQMSELIQTYIQRLAQKGRAAGIHLVICTQNPLSKEIGSTLKANLPVSICFRVKTETNSKVVLDFAGAEKLTGNGDGLILDSNQKEPLRFQSYFINN